MRIELPIATSELLRRGEEVAGMLEAKKRVSLVPAISAAAPSQERRLMVRMHASQAFRGLTLLLAVALAATGCAPGRRGIRLRAPEGELLTVSRRERPPVQVSQAELKEVARVLARDVVPGADPLRAAAEKLEIPIREGAFSYDSRTRRLTPLDSEALERDPALLEPMSKGVAAGMTVVLVAYLGVDTLYTLGPGWVELIDAADAATSFEELEKAGQSFGEVMGGNAARIVVLVATATLGKGTELAGNALAKRMAMLPRASEASELAVAEGGIALELVPAVESVAIGKDAVTIALAPGALAMASAKTAKARGGGSGGPGPRYTEKNFRANLAKLTGKDPADCHAHHVISRAVKKRLRRLGIDIDINDPRFGSWWTKTEHLSKWSEYNKRCLSS